MRGDVRGELDDALRTGQAVFHLRLIHHAVPSKDFLFQALHWSVLIYQLPSEVEFPCLLYHLCSALLGYVKLLGALLDACALGRLYLVCGILWYYLLVEVSYLWSFLASRLMVGRWLFGTHSPRGSLLRC